MSKTRRLAISNDEILNRLWEEEEFSDIDQASEEEEEEEEDTVERVFEVDVMVEDLPSPSPTHERLVLNKNFFFVLYWYRIPYQSKCCNVLYRSWKPPYYSVNRDTHFMCTVPK
jgi:hypothetical protein